MGISLWPRCLGYKCRPKGVLNLCDSIVVQGPAASPGSLLKMQTVRSLTNLLNQSLHFKRWILVDISPPSCPPYVVLVYAIKRPDSCCPPTSIAGAILRVCVSLRRCQGVWALCSAILPAPCLLVETAMGRALCWPLQDTRWLSPAPAQRLPVV